MIFPALILATPAFLQSSRTGVWEGEEPREVLVSPESSLPKHRTQATVQPFRAVTLLKKNTITDHWQTQCIST